MLKPSKMSVSAGARASNTSKKVRPSFTIVLIMVLTNGIAVSKN